MFNMRSLVTILILVTSALTDTEVTTATSTTIVPSTVYTPEQPVGYNPYQMFPYSDNYGGSLYDTLLYPPQPQPVYKPPPQQQQPSAVVLPAAQGAVLYVLRVIGKFGLFLMGGVALLVVGGIFTTAVCSLTPVCVISFPIFGGINKESVRSLMTPDKISAAAALVQDAIGKYQRLQRAVGH